MDRNIPGSTPVEGREFIYIECDSWVNFKKLFPRIALFGDSQLPKSGGALSENIAITLPTEEILFGLSYKGDLDGWQRKVTECAEIKNLKYGFISGDFLLLCQGEKVLLSDCKVEFIQV